MTIAGTGIDVYCGTISELAEDDVQTAQIHLAARFGVSRAAVSEMVERMRDDGLVAVDDGRLRLTAAGRTVAERAVRRHRLAERFLVDVLDLGWAEAHHEAGSWQHVLDEHTESALQTMLGDPATCPHRNPLPGTAQTDTAQTDTAQTDTHAIRLTELCAGAVARVVRIAERLEIETGMLESFERAGVMPGVQIAVVDIDAGGTVTVRGPRRHLRLTSAHALDVFVVPGDLAQISDAVARPRNFDTTVAARHAAPPDQPHHPEPS
jgi:DtxR family Mn-dependent transcriptional regulator